MKRFVKFFALKEPLASSPYAVHHGQIAVDTVSLAKRIDKTVDELEQDLLSMEHDGLIRLEWLDEVME